MPHKWSICNLCWNWATLLCIHSVAYSVKISSQIYLWYNIGQTHWAFFNHLDDNLSHMMHHLRQKKLRRKVKRKSNRTMESFKHSGIWTATFSWRQFTLIQLLSCIPFSTKGCVFMLLWLYSCYVVIMCSACNN